MKQNMRKKLNTKHLKLNQLAILLGNTIIQTVPTIINQTISKYNRRYTFLHLITILFLQ